MIFILAGTAIGAILGTWFFHNLVGIMMCASLGAVVSGCCLYQYRSDEDERSLGTSTIHIFVDNFVWCEEKLGLINQPLPLTLTHAQQWEDKQYVYIDGAEGFFKRPCHYNSASKFGWVRVV